MPSALPDSVDAWRMAQARRQFRGLLPLAQMPRLGASLASEAGDASFSIEFGTDEFGIAFLDLEVEAGLPLVCQRTLDVFIRQVSVRQRLGLISDEAREAALPEEYEALLVPDGQLSLKDVIEDELILAIPVVAISPGAPLENVPVVAAPGMDEQISANPFAILGKLKDSRSN